MIYFDNAATSFPKPPGMAEAMMEHMAAWCGNPGRSGHELSRRTEAAVSETRELLAEFIGAGDPSRIIFTSNATAALNLAIHGVLQEGDHVMIHLNRKHFSGRFTQALGQRACAKRGGRIG